MNDLEEDPTYRQNINIYKDTKQQNTIPLEDPSIPHITLEEMLDDLHIDDSEMTEVYE